jgi:filamentous hemagglutinin
VKLGEIVRRVNVDPRKLTEYALNPQAPWGRHKAIVFERALGFTRENYADLLIQIERRALEAEATFPVRTSSCNAIR